MGLIDTPEAATRLARAIIADVRLYNAQAIKQGRDVSDQVEEGRELFRRRVDPGLFPVFEQELGELAGGSVRPFESPAPREYPLVQQRPRQRSSAGLVVFLALFMLVALAAVVFFAARHH